MWYSLANNSHSRLENAMNPRLFTRSAIRTHRFFSSQVTPKVQFMHVIADPKYRLGFLEHAAAKYPNVTNSNPNAQHYNNDVQAIMEQQAKEVVFGMKQILQLSCSNRGAYEEQTGGTHINGNTIVHVATPEFFFYPALGLFSEELFEDMILVPLHKLLQDLPEWMHFHFGTMPVQLTRKSYNGSIVNTDTPVFINAAVYGNGGATPVVKHYSKKYAYKDIYIDHIDDTVRKEGDPYVHQLDSLSESYPRCVYSETPSGAGFVKTFDICIDHSNAVALDEYVKQSGALQRRDVKGFYAVTSNSVSLEPGKAVFHLVSQTDPSSNVVHSGAKEKRNFFSSTRIFESEQLSRKIPGEAKSALWVPFDLEVHKTVEMSEIADHTKAMVDENAEEVSNDKSFSP